jgi:ATPase subunit of ABC transporter with duplicated ATPase domains
VPHFPVSHSSISARRSYVRARGLGHHYGGEILFSGLDLVLSPGDRIGVVGPNGAGKSTLLQLLAGRLRPAAGHVLIAPGTRVGWSGDHEAGQTAGSYLAAGLGPVARLAGRMRALESAMAAGDGSVLAEYGAVQDEWSAVGGWTAQTRLDNVRDRLGLTGVPDDLALTAASGGELARLTLARLLLAEPDVLVLDEPTNHLDSDGAAWLGDYLARFGGGVLLASHDRGLLDRAVTQIIELDGVEPAFYQGGYTDYRQEKQRRWQRRLLDFEAQQKYRTRLEADIDAVKDQALSTELATRNDQLRRYAKKVAKKAKARERRLARQMQSVQWLAEPQTRPPLVLAMPDACRGPGLTARSLSVQVAGRVLLRDVHVSVRFGERVYICGPNGAGKTTLLRVLAGQLAPAAGGVEYGQADAREVDAGAPPAVLPQRHDDLPMAATVLGFLRSRLPLYAEDAEQLLTAYLFDRDQWRTQLRALSAGELRRLLLAILVNSGSPVLMLDEPTHYLDFDALDVVEEALRAYRGTLIMVTHDSYFADRVGFGQRWRVGDGTVTTEICTPAASDTPQSPPTR